MSRFREYHQAKGTRSSSSKKGGVELVNFDAIMLQIKKLPGTIKTQMVRSIIKSSLKPVSLAIKAKTPIRKKTASKSKRVRKRTNGEISTVSSIGNLRRSIGIKTFASKGRDVTGYAGIQNGKNIEGMEGKYNDGWYGYFVERGTKYQAAKPFIAPAAAKTMPKAKEDFTIEFNKYVVRNAKRLGLDAK